MKNDQNSVSELMLVPPHPDLQGKIVKEIEKLRSKDSVLSNKITILKEDHVGMDDGLIYPGTLFPLGTTASVAQNAAPNRAPITGTVRVVVVLANFSDVAMTHSAAHFNDLFFSLGVIPTGSVREYYREVSNNIVDIQGQVVGPVTLSHTMSYYANGDHGTGSSTPNARTMAKEAAQLANPLVNFSLYDNDGDGYVDAYIVIHAGPGGEVTGNTNHIWSHKWVLPSVYNADGKNIYAYLTIPEDCKIGVSAHELGHLVFGFPDLYDTDYSSEGIGNWCLMAGGSWNNGGNTPAHPSAWCKAQQGWVTVVNQTTNATVNVTDVKSSHKVYRLWKNGGASSEYFLVENRQKTGFDAHLPGSGLLVWHIDDAISNNSNEAHYKVALMQADGKKDLELHHQRGDGGDPYPGTSNNTSFNKTSNPNSKSYAGSDTCVAITNIGPSGPTMSVKFQVKCKLFKEFKEIKEIKEKDFKELKKDIAKDFEKPSWEKPLGDKPIKEKSEKEIFEKPGEGKLVDNPGLPGGGGLEQRIGMLESRLSSLEPFISQALRPDLTMGAYAKEDDMTPPEELSAEEKRSYDTKQMETI